MRLKQLLGVIFLTLIASTLALAANSQLTSIDVTGAGRTTTVLLHANGAFTHTEYRPVDNLLLVDLAGVTAGKLKDTTHPVNKAGVDSYRVLGYNGANGVEVTRVEITLTAGAVVNVATTTGGLELRVSGSASDASPATPAVAAAHVSSPKPAVKTVALREPEPETEASPAKAPAHRVQVKHVSVVRGKSGMESKSTIARPLRRRSSVWRLPIAWSWISRIPFPSASAATLWSTAPKLRLSAWVASRRTRRLPASWSIS